MKNVKLSLRKRPQYDEMIDEIEFKQSKIKYPNRNATFARRSPYLSQFDGDSSLISLEEQESNIAKEQMLQQTLRLLSARDGLTHRALHARSGMTSPSYPPSGLSEYDDAESDFTGYADDYRARKELLERVRAEAMAERVRLSLDEHIRRTADGLFAEPEEEVVAEPDPSYESTQHVREILNDIVDRAADIGRIRKRGDDNIYQPSDGRSLSVIPFSGRSYSVPPSDSRFRGRSQRLPSEEPQPLRLGRRPDLSFLRSPEDYLAMRMPQSSSSSAMPSGLNPVPIPKGKAAPKQKGRPRKARSSSPAVKAAPKPRLRPPKVT
jgi:hypothetical protein